MDIPVVTQYSMSLHSCSTLHDLIPNHPAVYQYHSGISYGPLDAHITLIYTCVIQSNILLANMESGELKEGISTDINTHCDDKTSGGATAVCLSSMLGIKANNLENQWNHFIDRQHIPLDLHIVQNSCLKGDSLLQRHQEAEMGVGSAADDKMQAKIEEAVHHLPKEHQCGGHSISWEELVALGGSNGLNDLLPSATDGQAKEEVEEELYATEIQPVTEVGSTADDGMQAKIEEAVHYFPQEELGGLSQSDGSNGLNDLPSSATEGLAIEEARRGCMY
ncbi:uncharacterized protein BJ212DRAFT_1295662 [Suillus subaureus]|uniref:Uncharacterized protein n=1 Tax=Suillus subaureus TaxID=48587 RepID=A0A9P7ELT1_9AGAM|nr:uncharacterized protein BJ212DRAFT_1295662 [Suillus subaureus]KAG1824513.1 hypothetical protein BJ212DRAFT_1295662 [Suillus subaureus]